MKCIHFFRDFVFEFIVVCVIIFYMKHNRKCACMCVVYFFFVCNVGSFGSDKYELHIYEIICNLTSLLRKMSFSLKQITDDGKKINA